MTFTSLQFGDVDNKSVRFVRDNGQAGIYPQPTPGRHVDEEADYIINVGPISAFVAPIVETDQQLTDAFRGQSTVLRTALEVIAIQAGFADADAFWDAVRDAL